MMTKSKIFTFLAALFLICLVFSHASPLPSKPVRHKSDKAVVEFPKLDGKIIFTQINATHVKANGKLNKGILKDRPKEYFIKLASLNEKSFEEMGIKIKVPGTKEFEVASAGKVSQLIGLKLSILHKKKVLDSEKIKKGILF
ncbi:hypothetical protein Glove_114g146 [Diversispora epigaea]|uniref:Uncharacterized protein n=1 Tax=Diversispora epigaea TaxID=1348612 RepID=A0A397J1A2_9GLOM|nr:hypothetical protein Glove_114g145 [Diversispora epigaea]RHZ82075.1 hypothetical protein Glove_114g146 [Diversispora epigaea]